MPELRWIDRDKDGKIAGHYACKQRDGQESLWEDCAENVNFFLGNGGGSDMYHQQYY